MKHQIIKNNAEAFEKYYDEIELCENSTLIHYKSAIQILNRYMIDRSDLAIFCVKQKGGAYQTLQYARRISKNLINIYDLDKQ